MNAAMHQMFVGRQPIYTPQLDVFGYELLFRGADENQANVVDGDQATATVILNTLEIGIDEVVGELPAFINITRNFLLGDHCKSLPNDRVVLEVLEDIEPETSVIQALTELSAAGYTIALDDFIYDPRLLPLIEVANIAKIDLLEVDKEDLSKHVAILRQHDIDLLIEKVETYQDVEFCKELGFDYFQGYFFCRPKVISGVQLAADRLSVLQLIARLQDPSVQPSDLDEVISTNLPLSYKVLRFVNFASSPLNRKVESIRQAVILAGLGRIRTWATLLMFASIESKPRELVVAAAIRGKMCELLAIAMNQDGTDRFFSIGLLSLLDAFMDRPLAELLDLLPLGPELDDGLRYGEGVLGETLRCVVNYEQSNWDKVSCRNLTGDAIRVAYLEAISWSRQLNL